MYWDGFRLSVEDILGTFHVVLRCRRSDCGDLPAWDDLYRDLIYPPGDIEPQDIPGWILYAVGRDLLCLDAETGPF